MRAFVLAGGFATRLWPLTEHRAKPLLPIAGKPIITHLVEKIPAHLPVTVSTNAVFGAGFRTWMEKLGRNNLDLVIEGTRRDDQKLGALGSIADWVQAEKVDDDILVLTGDNYLGFALERFIEAFNGNPLLAAHDIGDLERAKAFGTVIIDRNSTVRGRNTVAGFEEKPRDPKSTLVSAGCAILPKNTLPVLLEFAKKKPDNLGGIFEEFLRQKITVECFSFTERWMDIGSFQSYLEAHKLLLGDRTLGDATAKITGSQCTGSVSIGKECSIDGSELKDCMIFDRVTIRNCTIRNCVIDEGCHLEGIDLKGQMLRAGTRLIVQ